MACYSNFTGDPNHLEELNKLQLSQEESTLSIWKQIIDSHVVESSDVNILTDKNECDDLNVASKENDQDEYFSDGEYTPENTMKAKNSKLQLRAYQKELAVKALQGLNAVICAPTGSGKTRVATYIIQNHFQRTDGPRKKKVAFLAKTVPLATQQYKSLRKYLPDSLKTICVTGKDKNSSNLRMLLKYNDVLVMTPMILVNNLQRKGLKLSKFTLLVFDECHHTRNFEPYNLLMSDYLKAKLQGTLSHLPQIVGLTASIGIEKSKTLNEAKESVLEVLGNLDAPHMCTVVENKAELRKTVPVPTEEMFSLKELVPDECYTKITDIVMKLEEHVKQYAKALGDKTVSELAVCAPKAKNDLSYGQWVVKLKKAALSLHMGVNNLTVRHLVMISNYLMAYNFALESYDLIESTDVVKYLIKSFKEYVEKLDKTEVETILCNYFEELVRLSSKKVSTNPNLEILSAIIKQRMANSQDSRCIIFVRTRALAEALADWLNRSELSVLRASVFTGTSASEEKGGMSKDQQEGARFNFEHGYVKILVATSVAEEGIDIANCNLVIKYNKIGNEVTTVQTRGRSRKFGGISVLLAKEKVCQKERENQERARLMEMAIEEISTRDPGVLQDIIRIHQLKQNIATAETQRSSNNEPFKLICRMCRTVEIQGSDVRNIMGKYFVPVDRALFDGLKIKCKTHAPEPMDGLEFVGEIFCNGDTEPGKKCGHKLGIMIKYGSVPYLSIKADKFSFLFGNMTQPTLFKKWKQAQAKFYIAELTKDDIKRYIQLTDEDFAGLHESDEETSSSDDE